MKIIDNLLCSRSHLLKDYQDNPMSSATTTRCSRCGWPKDNPRIGVQSDSLRPGYGACLRCRTNWAFVDGHSTSYSATGGMFPLCEMCWAELTPAERLPFYRVLYDQWRMDALQYGYPFDKCWEDIERAVLEGK